MIKAVQPILDEIIPIALEAPLYSNQLRMAGRVDCVGLFDNNLSIIDLIFNLGLLNLQII